MKSTYEATPNSNRDSGPSRREFAKLLGCAVLAGAGIAATRPLVLARKPKATEPVVVAGADEIPIGGSRLFRYPTEHDPCILVRLEADRFVAYSQSCTHLMCPVHFQLENQQFVCPCHEGYFSAVDGAVLAGPPRRPLPSFAVEIRDGQILISPQKPVRA